MLYYHEVFPSIQGESSSMGKPCVFIRLFGCNLRCVYCDQPQAPSDRKRISLENLVYKVMQYRIEDVCITGGEPLLQDEIYPLIYELVSKNFKVSIETNGSVVIPEDPYARSFKYVMDVKSPSSKVSTKNILSNLTRLQRHDEVKFVIADRKDYDYAKNVLREYPTKASILFSPMFDRDMKQHVGQDLCNWLIEDRIHRARVQLQMHKIIGVQ